jgi:hypothetical protein
MMKRVAGIVLLLALSFSLGRARLGESEYRCIDRYGDVQRKALRTIGGVDYNTLYFPKNGFIVVVIFSEGNAAVVLFVKADNTPMDDSDIQSLLATEGEKFKWSGSSSGPGQRTWTRADGAVAIYRTGDHALTMGTKPFAEMVLHPPPSNNNPATEGF